MEAKLKELYAEKGEIVTKIELFQMRLQRVNQEILQLNRLLQKDKGTCSTVEDKLQT